MIQLFVNYGDLIIACFSSRVAGDHEPVENAPVKIDDADFGEDI